MTGNVSQQNGVSPTQKLSLSPLPKSIADESLILAKRQRDRAHINCLCDFREWNYQSVVRYAACVARASLRETISNAFLECLLFQKSPKYIELDFASHLKWFD